MVKRKKTQIFLLLSLLVCTGSLYGQRFSAARTEEITELNREGIELSEQGRHSEAVAKFRQAIELEDTSSAKSYNNLGFALQKSDNREEAIEAYYKAVERDSTLLPPLQNLGLLLYREERYHDAVDIGERTLEIDPDNRAVMQWLPEARRLAALQKDNEKGEDSKQKDCNCEHEGGSLELGYVANGVFFYKESNRSFKDFSQRGMYKYPMNFHLKYQPTDTFSINAATGSPYMGIEVPPFMAERNRLDFIFHLNSFYIGPGFMVNSINLSNHYDNDSTALFENTTPAEINDTKFGLIAGTDSDGKDLSLEIFTRYLFADKKSTSTSTAAFDMGHIAFTYKTESNLLRNKLPDGTYAGPLMFIYFKIIVDEFFITEYNIPSTGGTVGHYFGKYDFSLTFEFGSVDPEIDKTGWLWGINLIERLYFKDVDDTSPRAFGNGQGYFGFDTESAVKGNAFPGFNTNAHIFEIYFKEVVFKNYILYQKLGFELLQGGAGQNAFMLDLGITARF